MKTWHKVASLLVLTGVIAASLVFYFMYNKPHPDYENMEAAFTLSSADLYKEFTADKTKAGNKYNGKVVEVTGRLSKVEVADSLTICVFAFNQGVFGDEGMRCTMLPGYSGKAKHLQPGADLKLKGFCSGFNDTDVILDKCSFVK
ncbi:MAG: hypothetical protein NTU51_01925 [Bacteroidetes bacterium]|nr:hypothetical protein [Bacteroidota bacterium]